VTGTAGAGGAETAGAPPPPFRFALPTRVEIADTDLGGVVYYGRYSLYLDRGAVAYRRRLGIPPLGPDGHLFVVRAFEMEYLAAARYDDALEVLVRTAAVGRTSHTLECRVDRPGEDARQVLVRARITIVGVSGYAAPRPTRLPAEVALALREFEGITA
jgi:acyl-CoA thioester hydrolase